MTRMMRILVLALCTLAALYLYLDYGSGSGTPFGFQLDRPAAEGAIDLDPESSRTQIDSLEYSDERLMGRQRSVVDELARRHVGSPLTGGALDDLRILQELLDQRVLQPEQTYELQALGVVLGDVMVAQLGFSWAIVEDELGRSRALRLGTSDELVYPVTMISKRVERDVRFTVRELYDKAQAIAERRGAASY
jgi:hypothetical protein